MILMQQGKIPLPCNKEEPTRGALCPTMDLIAFAGGGMPQVYTFRSIDWEKIFTATCAGSSGALAWRPDGKELAVATSSGEIILLKTETGQEREMDVTITQHGATITSLFWTADQVTTEDAAARIGDVHADEEKTRESDEDDADDAAEQYFEENSSDDEDEVAHHFLRPPARITGKGEGDLGMLLSGADRIEDRDAEDEVNRMSANARCDRSLLGGKTLDILVAGDGKALISMRAFGQVLIGVIDVSDVFLATATNESHHTVASHVYLSSDLSVLVAVLRRFHPDTNMDEYRVCTVKTTLGQNKKYIALIASEFSSISRDLILLKQSLQQAAKAWEEGVIAQLKKLLIPLLEEEEESLTRDFSEGRRLILNQLLFDLLVRGIYKATLVKFFTKLTDSHLTRLQRVLENACDTVVRLMDSSASRCMESLIFRLGDLLGKARSEPQVFARLGIDPEYLAPFLKDAEKLLLATRRVCSVARQAKQNLGAFQRWLVGCRRRWPGAHATTSAADSAAQDGGFIAAFSREDARRVERMLVESDLEHVELSLELGLEKFRLVPPKAAAVASWDRNFTEVNDEEILTEAQQEQKDGGLAGMIRKFEVNWDSVNPQVRDAISRTFLPVEVRGLVNWPCQRFRGENDSKITLGGGYSGSDRGKCYIGFVDPSTPNAISLWSMSATEASGKWQPRCDDFIMTEGQADVTNLEFCTESPGRKPSLENSLLCYTSKEPHSTTSRIGVIGLQAGKMSLLKERIVGGEDATSMRVCGLASSGPRGVACVLSSNRKFELYDIVHDEEDESNMYDSALQEEGAEDDDQL